MGGEKASAAKQREGPVNPRKRGSGLRVSIVSLEVLRAVQFVMHVLNWKFEMRKREKMQ